MNDKIWKKPFLHHRCANCHTCESDVITLVGSMCSFEVTLIVCHNFCLLRFSLPKIGGGGGCKKLRSQFVIIFSFDQFWVFTNSKFFQCYRLFVIVWGFLLLIWIGANKIKKFSTESCFLLTFSCSTFSVCSVTQNYFLFFVVFLTPI